MQKLYKGQLKLSWEIFDQVEFKWIDMIAFMDGIE